MDRKEWPFDMIRLKAPVLLRDILLTVVGTAIYALEMCIRDSSFTVPALAFIAIFMIYPIWYNIVMSFKEINISNLTDASRQKFIGFANFSAIFADKYFWNSFQNTFVFVLFSLIFQFSVGFLFALYFNKQFRGAKWMRAIILIAWMNPGIITGAIFKWLLAGDIGIFNYLLMQIGIISEPINFLASTQTSLASVILGNVWIGIPFNMVCLLYTSRCV